MITQARDNAVKVIDTSYPEVVGVKTIAEALHLAFPTQYKAWKEGQEKVGKDVSAESPTTVSDIHEKQGPPSSSSPSSSTTAGGSEGSEASVELESPDSSCRRSSRQKSHQKEGEADKVNPKSSSRRSQRGKQQRSQ